MARRYETPIRDQRAEQTRERIVAAGADLVHAFPSWDWKDLTFRAVAQRAGVGERTVYRHFPTVRLLHDAVMQRLEVEAGISYEQLSLDKVADVAARVFATRASFAVESSATEPEDPTLVAVDVARRDALCQAVVAATPGWSADQQRALAAVVDVLWGLTSYERLVRTWNFNDAAATAALRWVIELVLGAVDRDEPPG